MLAIGMSAALGTGHGALLFRSHFRTSVLSYCCCGRVPPLRSGPGCARRRARYNCAQRRRASPAPRCRCGQPIRCAARGRLAPASAHPSREGGGSAPRAAGAPPREAADGTAGCTRAEFSAFFGGAPNALLSPRIGQPESGAPVPDRRMAGMDPTRPRRGTTLRTHAQSPRPHLPAARPEKPAPPRGRPNARPADRATAPSPLTRIADTRARGREIAAPCRACPAAGNGFGWEPLFVPGSRGSAYQMRMPPNERSDDASCCGISAYQASTRNVRTLIRLV
jgi:hypothetical protein